MKIEIDVPDYSEDHGLRMEWESGYEIRSEIKNGVTVITANEAGLISLARLLLTLTSPSVPVGHHWHLDEPHSLEPGSTELIIVKE